MNNTHRIAQNIHRLEYVDLLKIHVHMRIKDGDVRELYKFIKTPRNWVSERRFTYNVNTITPVYK